jgi:xanthine dehydrogenase accessory factor
VRSDILLLAAELAQRGEPFALAIVVRRQPATSAQLGDMALIAEAGEFHGWLGGSCTQPNVVSEAQRALADGVPRLVALSPDPGADVRPGVTPVAMTCASGGSVDIYVEPVLPPPRLLVFGASPTARAVASVGKAMGYAVDVADPLAEPGAFPGANRVFTDLAAPELRRLRTGAAGLFVIIATMGQNDEQAALLALELNPAYLGMVASRKRFEQVCETLAARGISKVSLSTIKNPAGLDIGAKSPEEVAISILAEIVQVRRAAVRAVQAAGAATAFQLPEQARDPVCGMTVTVATAAHRAEFGGREYFFCCGGCRERFLAAPQRYVAEAVRGGPA